MMVRSHKISLQKKVSLLFVLIFLTLAVFIVGMHWQNHLLAKDNRKLADLQSLRNTLLLQEITHLQDLKTLQQQVADASGKTLAQHKSLNTNLKKFSTELSLLQKQIGENTDLAAEAFELAIINARLQALLQIDGVIGNEFLYLRQIDIDLFEWFFLLDAKSQEAIQAQTSAIVDLQDDLFWKSLGMLFLCLGVIVMVLISMNRHIQTTIGQLIEFTHNVSQGFINQKLAVKNDDEISELVQSFNQMTENLAIASDILDERDKLKDDFVNVVSHEIRTPIAILQRVIDNLQSGLTGNLNTEQANLIKIAENNVARLAHLIKNLLDMARLESGQLKMNLAPISVDSLLQEVSLGFVELAKNEKLELHITNPVASMQIAADVELLIQVLTNFFNNALRYAKAKIIIQAKLDRLNGQSAVRISVIDDGVGISANEQKKLFNKFVQIHRQNKGSGYKGTGLGLAICKQIIEQHNGTIGVLSQSGRGAEFYFVLPQA